ncbi:hypothetical protein [Neisseria zalophi]|nr:hypothetical protein [Neisseria zalophi]
MGFQTACTIVLTIKEVEGRLKGDISDGLLFENKALWLDKQALAGQFV